MLGVFCKIGSKPSIRPRMGKSSAEERFTLLFVSSRGRSRSVGFSLKTLKALRWVGLILVCVLLSFVTIYRSNSKELGELRYMRDVAESQKDQIHSLQDQFSTLNERLRQTEIIETQIREVLKREGIVLQGNTQGEVSATPASRTSSVLTSRDGSSVSRMANIEDMARTLYSLKSAAGQLVERAGKVEKNIKDLHQEASDAVAVMRATPNLWPAAGDISSPFGWRRSPFDGYTREFHYGLDIAAQYWAPIAATADGVVAFSGYKYGYGWTIVIQHGYGFETLYAHCCSLKAEWGEQVKRGDVIAYVGQSGIATGPHLHYEVHLWDSPVDPKPYLPDEVVEVNHSVR